MHGFTCNYCGETLRSDEYIAHVEQHDREDGTPKGGAPHCGHDFPRNGCVGCDEDALADYRRTH